MKITSAIIASLIGIQLYACKADTMGNPENHDTSSHIKADSMKINITIGTQTFTATLHRNPTVTAFITKLPVTLNMIELNGNEKYANLPSSLPTDSKNPGTIQSGDLVLYGSKTLVIFYKTFPTSYSYTPLGRIDNPAGLPAVLGSGNVNVIFQAE